MDGLADAGDDDLLRLQVHLRHQVHLVFNIKIVCGGVVVVIGAFKGGGGDATLFFPFPKHTPHSSTPTVFHSFHTCAEPAAALSLMLTRSPSASRFSNEARMNLLYWFMVGLDLLPGGVSWR